MEILGVSEGYAIGNAYVRKSIDDVTPCTIDKIEYELHVIDRIHSAVIDSLNDSIFNDVKPNQSIIKEYASRITSNTRNLTEMRQKTCEWVVLNELEWDTEFSEISMGHFGRLQNEIAQKILQLKEEDYLKLNQDIIYVADELFPEDTLCMALDNIVGFVNREGSDVSHAVILAKSLSIPCIIGVNGKKSGISMKDKIIVDGTNGIIFVNPTSQVLNDYEELISVEQERKRNLEKYIARNPVTRDNISVDVFSNLGLTNEIDTILNNGSGGIGVVRTEFLYMNRDCLPNEEEQFQIYRYILRRMEGKDVIFRTLDIGGDKNLSYLNIGKEANPFLGLRAIRYCLKEQHVFVTQLRALLRASIEGNMRIMFPMISSLDEFRDAKKVLSKIKDELMNSGISFNQNIKVGLMIEVPSAVMISDKLAQEADFFSIGTNDLIQYSTATDRLNKDVRDLYSPYHPAILMMINKVIKSGKKYGIPVGICGETASNPKLIPIFLGMGLDEFSVSPNRVLETKEMISKYSVSELVNRIDEILNLDDKEKVLKYIDREILL